MSNRKNVKPSKKLQLKAEILRQLTNTDLSQAAGGISCVKTCYPSDCCCPGTIGGDTGKGCPGTC